MLAIFTIVFTFCTNVPLINAAGLIFFILRYFVDGLNLLTVHRGEIGTFGKLYNNIIIFSGLSCLFVQIVFGFYFAFYYEFYNCAVSFILAVVTLILIIKISSMKILNYEQDFKEIDRIYLGGNNLEEWQNSYKHPMIIHE